MSYEIIWEERGAYRRFWGVLSSGDIRESVERLCGDPRFDGLRYVISDMLGVTDYDVNRHAIEYANALRLGAKFSNPTIRDAFVTLDEVAIAAVFEGVLDRTRPFPTEVFPTVQAARAWTGS